MTQFHADDYIEFLSKITPSNMGNFVKEQHKCQLVLPLSSGGFRIIYELTFV